MAAISAGELLVKKEYKVLMSTSETEFYPNYMDHVALQSKSNWFQSRKKTLQLLFQHQQLKFLVLC